jgi:hypothetical protein
MSRNDSLMSRDDSLMSRDDSIVSRDDHLMACHCGLDPQSIPRAR